MRPNRKNIEVEKPELEKRYQEIIEKKKKTAATKKPQRKQKMSEDAKVQAEKENGAAAGANCDNAEAKTEEVDRMCTGSMINDSVETANEADWWHRERPVLRTVSEDEDHIVFHNGHVEHDMNDGLDENEKTEGEWTGIESTSTETTTFVTVETARETGEEHSDRSKVIEEADRTVGDGHHARCFRLVVEAGSIVLQVSNNMSEEKTEGEEAGETTAATETEEISKKGVEIRRLIEERRSTPKEERDNDWKKWANLWKMFQRWKRMKRQQDSQRILEDFKGVRKITGIKSAKNKEFITKIKNERGEIITSREGIANLYREYDDNEQDESEQEIGENENESSTDVHNNGTDEMTRTPEITTEELRTAINKFLKKQITRQQWNPSRRHQSMRRRDERNEETDFQRNRKAERVHAVSMEESEK